MFHDPYPPGSREDGTVTNRAYTVAQLAERWSCSDGTIYGLIRSGDLRSFRIGTLIRVSADEVERVECASSSTGESGQSSDTTQPARREINGLR